MKKILITRRLLRSCEDKAVKVFDAKLNSNDELYSQEKLLDLSVGCDGILSSLTDKLDEDTINKLPGSVKILSNFAVGFGNINIVAAKKKNIKFFITPKFLNVATPEGEIFFLLVACRRVSEVLEAVWESSYICYANYLF